MVAFGFSASLLLLRGKRAFKLDMVDVLRIEVLSAILDFSYEGDISQVTGGLVKAVLMTIQIRS